MKKDALLKSHSFPCGKFPRYEEDVFDNVGFRRILREGKENLDKFLHLLESAFRCSGLVVDQLWEEHLVMSLKHSSCLMSGGPFVPLSRRTKISAALTDLCGYPTSFTSLLTRKRPHFSWNPVHIPTPGKAPDWVSITAHTTL